ncbi:uncharacterized protein LOC143460972 [Clavelina lepadiformis]|uniref:uncharacterized protein LOC143460972 n=1 Tax=Clavelina lepadiformis TaxID=159417 RepID=UPI004041EB9E
MIKMSDRRKKKYDTGKVLSKEQIKILEIEYERNQYISIDRQIQLAEEFNVDLRDIREWFLDRLANDEYKAREKAKLRPNSNNLSEYASSSSSLFTTAKPLPRLQPLDFSRLTASPAAHATDSGLNDFYDDLLQYPHVGGGLPHNLYLKPQHYMTFPSLNGVGSKIMTSQGNSSRSGQAAVADTTPTSSQQNTTIQPQSSNQQRVLRKKEVQQSPNYSDFEKRKSAILLHLNSFTSKKLITKKKTIEGEHMLYHRQYFWISLCYLTVFTSLG